MEQEDSWRSSLFDLPLEQSPTDYQEQVRTDFPVHRNSRDPTAVTILPSVRDKCNTKSGQQPTGSSCDGQLDSAVEASSHWHESVQEPIDIGAVEEEGVEQFVDTPWSIARRLAAQPNKRKASHQDFCPKFALKPPPPNSDEVPEETIHLSSNDIQQGFTFGSPVKELSNRSQFDKLNLKAWFERSGHDSSFNQSRGKFLTSEIVSSESDFPSLALHSSEEPTASLSHQKEDQKYRYNSRIASKYAAFQNDPILPLNSQIAASGSVSPEDSTDQTGIQNTTSVIDNLPQFTSSTIQEERVVHDGLNYNRANYNRATICDDENNPEELYGEGHAGHEIYYHSSMDDSPPLEEEFEINQVPSDGSINDAYPDYLSPLSDAIWHENQWNDDNNDNVDRDLYARGTLAQTNFNQSSNLYLQDPDQPEQAESSPQYSSRVGRLSGYSKKNVSRFPRAPAYARGSSSNRIPAEVYHFKPMSHHDDQPKKNKRSFHDQVNDYKYQRTNDRSQKKLTPPVAVRRAKLSALYEPSSTIKDFHNKNVPSDEAKNDLQLPKIRSRAIKPTACSKSRAKQTSKFNSASRKHSFNYDDLDHSTRTKKKGIKAHSFGVDEKHSLLEKQTINQIHHLPECTRVSKSDDDITVVSPSPKNNHLHVKHLAPSQLNEDQFAIYEGTANIGSDSESDEIEILEEPQNLLKKNVMQHRKSGNTEKNGKNPLLLEPDLGFNIFSDIEEIEESKDTYMLKKIAKAKEKDIEILEKKPSTSLQDDKSVNPQNKKQKNCVGVIMRCNVLNKLSVSRCRELNRLMEAQVAMKQVWLL